MTLWQFYLGVSSVGCFILTIHAFEKRYFAPATIFVLFYASATIFTPWHRVRFTDLTGYDLDFFPVATAYSLIALWALWLGYVIAPRRRYQSSELSPFLSKDSYFGLRVALVLLFTVRIGTMLLSGTLLEDKGAGTYDGGLMRWVGHFTLLINPMFLLVLADILVRRWRGMRADVSYLGFFSALVLLMSMATFSRQAFVWPGLYFFLFYHSRKGFSYRQLSYCTLLVVVLCVASGLRSLGTGVLNMSSGDAQRVLMDSLRDVDLTASSISASVAGQEVFTNVLAYVPQVEGYAYGRTYWDSCVGLLLPRFLTGRFDEADITTPASWYKNWYSPDTIGHGFDFSMLAEAYMNFGSGAVVCFFGVGILVGYLSHSIRYSPSSLHVCICIAILTALCLGLRNDSNAVVKAAFYFSVFFWGVVRYSNRRSRATGRWSGLVGGGPVASFGLQPRRR